MAATPNKPLVITPRPAPPGVKIIDNPPKLVPKPKR
jgi:hypothetical protein